MTKAVTLDEIKKLIPHRHPFLLIDRIADYTVGEHLVAIKDITINEPYFKGHFPTFPVMPGVMLIETMAQAGALLEALTFEQAEGEVMFLVGVDEAKFKNMVRPGDQLRIEVSPLKHKRNFVKFTGQITVKDEVVCHAVMNGIKRVP